MCPPRCAFLSAEHRNLCTPSSGEDNPPSSRSGEDNPPTSVRDNPPSVCPFPWSRLLSCPNA
eukprot:2737100-Heterocapsa_arctica.AAC.1